MNTQLKLAVAASLAFAGLSLGTAHAAGPFDGHWGLDATGAGRFNQNQQYQCPPVHLDVIVTNGVISGSIEPHEGYVQQVSNGYDSDAWPITGTIGNNGEITMRWHNRVATGMARRHGLEVTWEGACGERVMDGRPE